MVTVFFSDIENYTKISSSLTPMKVSDLLGRLYTRFDNLSKKYGVKKVETIGDAYMAVTNLTEDQSSDHAKRIAEFSLAAIDAANDTLIDMDDPDRGYLRIRCGFASGPVVANVVGSLNPRVRTWQSNAPFFFDPCKCNEPSLSHNVVQTIFVRLSFAVVPLWRRCQCCLPNGIQFGSEPCLV